VYEKNTFSRGAAQETIKRQKALKLGVVDRTDHLALVLHCECIDTGVISDVQGRDDNIPVGRD
jgi:hypothetical protein